MLNSQERLKLEEWADRAEYPSVWQRRWPLLHTLLCLCDVVLQTKIKPVWLVTFTPPAQPCLISLKPLPPLSCEYAAPQHLDCLYFFHILFQSQDCFVSLCLWSSPPDLLQACMSNRLAKKRGGLLHSPPGVVSQACVFSEKSGTSGVGGVGVTMFLMKKKK